MPFTELCLVYIEGEISKIIGNGVFFVHKPYLFMPGDIFLHYGHWTHC